MNSVTVSKTQRTIEGAAMLRSYRNSGMKLKEWLSQNNISKDKYYYWRRKLHDTYLDICSESFVADEPLSFVEIPVPPASQAADVEAAANVSHEASASVTIKGCTVNICDSASVSFLMKLFEAAGNVS